MQYPFVFSDCKSVKKEGMLKVIGTPLNIRRGIDLPSASVTKWLSGRTERGRENVCLVSLGADSKNKTHQRHTHTHTHTERERERERENTHRREPK